jgi:23S rRNA pseudouridine2457 synthase
VLSQFTVEHDGQRTLAEFFSDNKLVYPIGRLDADSEGLLILSDDKVLNIKLLDPRHAHTRTYWVQVEGTPTPTDLNPFWQGMAIKIDGKMHQCLPAQAVILENMADFPPRNPPVRYRADIPTTWISVRLTEGKNRQVRRMCAGIGFPALRLLRASIENLELKDLQAGERIEISRADIYRKLKIE